jgi:hypothetical protein
MFSGTEFLPGERAGGDAKVLLSRSIAGAVADSARKETQIDQMNERMVLHERPR